MGKDGRTEFSCFSRRTSAASASSARFFLGSGSANSHCAKTTMKELIAEDTEAAEVRREKTKMAPVLD
jgi:type IV pilus biogenesis protein CpaD/CtpE